MGLLGVYGAHIRAEDQFRTAPDRSPGVPIDLKIFDFFGPKNRYFSPLNHRISTPGASGNHRGTCGNISWIYGYNTVHISYSSSWITSFFWVIFRVIFGVIFGGHFSGSFAENGFSDLIREIYFGKLPYGVGKPISGAEMGFPTPPN